MKFKSRKDAFFYLFAFGFLALFLGIIFIRIWNDGEYNFMWIDILLLLISALLFWIYFGTQYELTPTELKYQSGPIKGKIEIDKITEIIKGKSLWSGLRPATAKNGLILKYEKYNEIYISPKTNDFFVDEILKINQKIKISGK